MRQIVRYRFMTIPNKLVGEIRITVDEKQAEYGSLFDGGKATNITLYPVINLQMLKNNSEVNDAGLRTRTWDINDSIGLTKFTLPIFLSELKSLETDMKIPELYSYHGTRLEINQELADKVRKVFMIGNTTVEFSPVLLEQEDNRLEGIKIKFNNEKSSMLMTINELTALVYNIESIDVDSVALTMYTNFVQRRATEYKPVKQRNSAPVVDITPKAAVDEKVDISELPPTDFSTI